MTPRQAIERIRITLTAERGNRDRFLREPRRSRALAEIDDALEALAILDEALATLGQPQQSRLI